MANQGARFMHPGAGLALDAGTGMRRIVDVPDPECPVPRRRNQAPPVRAERDREHRSRMAFEDGGLFAAVQVPDGVLKGVLRILHQELGVGRDAIHGGGGLGILPLIEQRTALADACEIRGRGCHRAIEDHDRGVEELGGRERHAVLEVTLHDVADRHRPAVPLGQSDVGVGLEGE